MANLSKKLETIILEFQDKELRSQQVTVNNHIETFNNIIINDRIPTKIILQEINNNHHLNINMNNFQSMLYRARKLQKKETVKQGVIQEKTKILTPKITLDSPIKKEKEIKDTLKTDVLEWQMKTPLRSEFAINLMKEEGLTIEDIANWGLNTESQVMKRLVHLQVNGKKIK